MTFSSRDIARAQRALSVQGAPLAGVDVTRFVARLVLEVDHDADGTAALALVQRALAAHGAPARSLYDDEPVIRQFGSQPDEAVQRFAERIVDRYRENPNGLEPPPLPHRRGPRVDPVVRAERAARSPQWQDRANAAQRLAHASGRGRHILEDLAADEHPTVSRTARDALRRLP